MADAGRPAFTISSPPPPPPSAILAHLNLHADAVECHRKSLSGSQGHHGTRCGMAAKSAQTEACCHCPIEHTAPSMRAPLHKSQAPWGNLAGDISLGCCCKGCADSSFGLGTPPRSYAASPFYYPCKPLFSRRVAAAPTGCDGPILPVTWQPDPVRAHPMGAATLLSGRPAELAGRRREISPERKNQPQPQTPNTNSVTSTQL